MTLLRTKRGFTLLELLIALSILIIMTGAAALYLGDILYKAKVAKAKGDMETIAGALILQAAEAPTSLLDSGLVGGGTRSHIGSGGSGIDAPERMNISALVGTYLMAYPQDPWNNDYKVNSYSGYVRTYGYDYKIGGTSKYDKDILNYYLPANLFLSKVRSEDLNDNGYLDTGDELRLYFSKSVRCNVTPGALGATANAISYNNTTANAFRTPYGYAGVDVMGSTVVAFADEAVVDGYGKNSPVIHLPAHLNLFPSWTKHDLVAYRPSAYDTDVRNCAYIDDDERLSTGEPGGIEGAASATLRQSSGFCRPADNLFFSSCFSRDLKTWMKRTGANRGSNSSNVDIGYEVYIPAYTNGSGSIDYANAYSIWESTYGYTAYKTTAEKQRIYLQPLQASTSRRILTWKDITD